MIERNVWVVMIVAAAAVSLVVGIILGGYLFRSAAGIPIEEIEFGAESGYLYDHSSFEGGCLMIPDDGTWEAFWEVHKSRRMSPPPVPEVEFSRSTVMACFLGWQPQTGAFIRIVGAAGREGGGYWVFVERHTSLSGLGAITNPYHLVQVPRPDGPSLFLDQETGELLPTLTFDPFPPWEGMGDWEACARQVPLGPEDAIRIAAAFRNITMAELRERWQVFAKAAYLNETGWVSEVDCETLAPDTLDLVTIYRPERVEHAGFGWLVWFSARSASLTVHDHIVDWQSGEILAWASGV